MLTAHISGLGQIQTSPHDVKPFAQVPFPSLQSDVKPPVSGLGMGTGMGALAPSGSLWPACPPLLPARVGGGGGGLY